MAELHDDDRVTRVREHLEQAGVVHCDSFESLVAELEEHWSESFSVTSGGSEGDA